MERGKRCQKWLLWAAVLLWAGLIFSLSAQNANHSNAMSGGLIRSVASVFPQFRAMDALEQNSLVAGLHTLVRKLAHWSLYFVLGCLATGLSFCYSLSNRARGAAAAIGCLLYAASDELHQYFIPGRSCELRDVLIDFCGALTGLLLVFLVRRLARCVSTKSKAGGGFSKSAV